MIWGKRLYDESGNGVGQKDLGERMLVSKVEESQAMKGYEREEEVI